MILRVSAPSTMTWRRALVQCGLLLLVGLSCVPASEPESPVQEEVTITEVKIEAPVYESPQPSGPVHLAENFDDADKFAKVWVKSQAKKDGIDEDIAKYDGAWALEIPVRYGESGNLGLVLKSKARHAAISTLLSKPFRFEGKKPLVVQYEVIFQEGQECGGAYLKLLSEGNINQDLRVFHDKTPYTIMFGPDKCGNDHKLHFIFRHKNPLNGTFEEKHAKKPKEKLEDFFKDKEPHLYTLVIRPDNTFTVKVDNNVVNEGSLLDDFVPPVNPPLEIEDVTDKKPEDWDDREKIPDPTATKPEDWDEEAPPQIIDETDAMPDGWLENEPLTVPNPSATKPSDWDEEMDGEWEAPEIPNPKCEAAPGCGPFKKKMMNNPNYKGKWFAPLISNPNYRGTWRPKMIRNPNYFNDPNPFKMTPIYALGFELWSMSPDILFDNVIVTDDESVAEKWSQDTFEIRRKKIAEESSSLWQTVTNFTAENPWIWSVYIILLSVPVLLTIYCCCFTSQEKRPSKPYVEETEPLNDEKDADESEQAEQAKDDEEELESEVEEDDKEDDNEDDEVEEATEIEPEITEVIENKKDAPTRTEGPRRRKPNKE